MLNQITTALRSSLARLQREGEPFIRDYRFPDGLSIKLRQRFPDWTPDTIARVLVGLRQYLLICIDAIEVPLPMPSKAVDAAWHEFILFTRAYCFFCDRAYGAYLHHTPTHRLLSAETAQIELGRLWYFHCIRSGQHPMDPSSLPILLTIDAELGMSDAPPPRLDDLAVLPFPVGMLDPRTGTYVPSNAERELESRRLRRRGSERNWGGGCSGGGGCSAGGGGHGGSGHGGCSAGGGCSGGGCGGGSG
jgi:hypothetical protein